MPINHLDQLDFAVTYNYNDYLSWEFEERVELIKGKIFNLSSSPGTMHQLILGEIFFHLSNYLHHSHSKIFVAPFDVRLILPENLNSGNIYTVVQPDICVICDPDKIDSKGCLGAPDLVIEVLSPGNTDKEMKEKFEIYEENGVREYWLVEPDHHIVLVYKLNNEGKFIGLKPFVESEILRSEVAEGFEVLVKDIFDV
jgi:Uma2 family endonuclease